MKKFKMLCMSLIIVTTFSIPVFAEGVGGKVLDLDACVNTAMENSYIIKSRENILEKSKKKYGNDLKSIDMFKKRLEDNDRFEELIKKDDRTEDEEREYQTYIRIYGKPIAYSEAKDMSNIVNTLPERDEYNIFQYTNVLQVAKNNIKQNIYEVYGDLIKSKDNLDLEEKKFQVAQQEYNKAKIAADLGVVSKLEEYEKNASYLNEKESYEKLKMQFKIETMNFNKLIGVPINTEYNKYLKEYYMESLPIKSYEEYVEEALKNRAEIINGERYLELRKRERNYTNQYDNEDDNNKINYDIDKDMLELRKFDIKLEVKRLYDDAEVKYKSYESSKKVYKEAKEKFDEVGKRYSLGMISKMEYDKETITFNNELLNFRNTERDIYIAKLRLENACSLGTDINKSSYN